MTQVNEEKLRELAEAGGSGWIGPEDQVAFNELVQVGLVDSTGEVDPDGDIHYAINETGQKWLVAGGKQFTAAEVAKAPDAPPIEPGTIAAPKKRARRTTLADAGIAVSAVSREIDTDDAKWNKPSFQRGKHVVNAMSAMREAIDFDNIPEGGSRHIASTGAVPEPWKVFSKLVAMENKRYATPRVDAKGNAVTITRKARKPGRADHTAIAFVYSRKYAISKTKPDDPRGAGARIFRLYSKDLA